MKRCRWKNRFGEELELRDISIRELAKAIGYAQPTVNIWATGRGNPSLVACVEIAKFLGISLDELAEMFVDKGGLE